MNRKMTPFPTPAPHIHVRSFPSSILFIVMGLSFMLFLCIIMLKILCGFPECGPRPQVAVPVVIEIPIAISISTQTVDDEHIGDVI